MIAIANAFVINKWVTSEDFKTWDVLGPRATLITGQVGSLYDISTLQTRYLKRAEIEGDGVKVADTIIVDPDVAAVGGDMRYYTVERDRNIRRGMWELVATERVAFTKARDIGIYLFNNCFAQKGSPA